MDQPLPLDLPPYTREQPQETHDNHMQPRTDLVLYLDGSCDPNPGGQMVVGLLIALKEKTLHEESCYCGGNGTNNKAEIHAFIRAAQTLRTLFRQHPQLSGPATFVSDSRIVVDAVRGINTFRNEELSELVERFRQQYALLTPRPHILWVKRKYNTAADRLSKQSRQHRRNEG